MKNPDLTLLFARKMYETKDEILVEMALANYTKEELESGNKFPKCIKCIKDTESVIDEQYSKNLSNLLKLRDIYREIEGFDPNGEVITVDIFVNEFKYKFPTPFWFNNLETAEEFGYNFGDELDYFRIIFN